jgi:hypothetical protein
MRTDSDDDSDFVSPSTLVGGGNVRRVDIINESDGDFEGSVVSRSPPAGTSDIVENPKRLKTWRAKNIIPWGNTQVFNIIVRSQLKKRSMQ